MLAYFKLRPEDLGWPSPENAWEEVTLHCGQPVSHNWSHLAVRVAGQETGWYSVRHAENESALAKLKRKFSRCYQELAKAGLDGAVIEPVEQLADLTGDQLRHSHEQLAETMKDQGITSGMSGKDARDRLKGLLG